MKGRLAVMALAVFATAATPAAAEKLGSTGGFTYVKREGVLPAAGSQTAARVSATCPKDTVRLGGGGSVGGTPSGTTLSSVATSTTRRWSVDAWHTGINTGSNSPLAAYAICTPKQGKVSDDSMFELVPAAPADGTVDVACTSGNAVGGGVAASGSAANFWLHANLPLDLVDSNQEPDDGWRGTMFHHQGSLSGMTVRLVCMEGKAPDYESKSRSTDGSPTLKAMCKDGKSVTGGGAFAGADASDSHVLSTVPVDSKRDRDRIPDDGWKASFYNDNAVNQTFAVTAICR